MKRSSFLVLLLHLVRLVLGDQDEPTRSPSYASSVYPSVVGPVGDEDASNSPVVYPAPGFDDDTEASIGPSPPYTTQPPTDHEILDDDLNQDDEIAVDDDGQSSPTPTFSPFNQSSSFPVSAPQLTLENANCTDAIIVNGTFGDSGNTRDATPLDGNSSALDCSLVKDSSQVVWYKVIGDDRCITASTEGSSFDTILAVYRGTCDNLQCLVQNDDSSLGLDLTSLVSFQAAAGSDYYLAVGGSPGRDGRFQLLITVDDCPSNTDCASSATIAHFPFNDTANYAFADQSGDPCSDADVVKRSLWYEVQGDGDCMVGELLAANYDTELSVLAGNCNNTVCEEQRRGAGSQLAVRSEIGVNYYWVAGGTSPDAAVYTIALDKVPCPANDQCTNATKVTAFPYNTSVYNVFSENVTASAVVCSAVGASDETRGSWFQIVGDGQCVTVRAQNLQRSQVIAVYEGTCANLTCLTQNVETVATDDIANDDVADDGAGVRRKLQSFSLEPEVKFASAVNATYYIFVGGYLGVTATFALDIEREECPVVPENDVCTNATTIDELPARYGGNLRFAKPDDYANVPSLCYQADRTDKTVWYEFEPDNDTCVTAEYTSPYYGDFSVYNGTSCGNLTCVDAAATNSDGLFFRAEAGTRYWFRLASGGFDEEAYVFRLSAGSCPENDVCEDALNVGTIPSVTLGSTLFASANGGYGSGSCDVVRPESPTVWYSLTGTGDCAVASLADDFDAAFAVFTGECNGTQECVGQAAYGADSLSWRTANGTIYYIAVTGSYSYSSRGHFQLILTEDPSCTASVANDHCNTSTPIMNLPFLDSVNTDAANEIGYGSPALSCFRTIGSASKGVWYSLNVTEEVCVVASTEGSDFDTTLALYEGNSCESLTCLTGNDDYIGLTSVVSWKLQPGAHYYLLAAGSGSNVGNLVVRMDNGTCLSNDECVDGTVIEGVPYVASGSLGFASGSANESLCSGSSSSYPDVWYTFESKADQCLAASVAVDGGSTTSIRVAVYSGFDCGNLTCQAESAYFEKFAKWRAVNGTTYWISVYSPEESPLPFVLTVHESECESLPSNDLCSSAIPLGPLPRTVAQNNVGATVDDDDSAVYGCDYYGSVENSLWYSLVGDGGCIRITLTSSFSGAVFVFSGGCGGLECVKRDYGAGSVGWKTEANVTYSIMVAGYYRSSYGTFSVDVESGECAENDVCDLAQTITNVPFVEDSSLEFASVEGFNSSAPVCYGVEPDSVTRWYELEGSGSCLSASIVSNFDSTLALYSGDCDSLSCIEQSGSSDNVFTFLAKKGTVYKLAVATGYEFDTGNYVLTLVDADSCSDFNVDNYRCASAKPITRYPFQDSWSNYYLEQDGNDSGFACPSVMTKNATFGGWYSVAGNGLCVSVETVGYFPTVLAVFEGSDCGNLTCVAEYVNSDSAYGNRLLWQTLEGVQYSVFIGGEEAGSFDLKVKAGECASSTSCVNASKIVEFPFIGSGSTDFVYTEGSNASVCSLRGDAPIVFYELVGTGDCMTASVTADVAHTLTVFSGECEDPICLKESDYDEELVTWRAVANTTYRIAVASQRFSGEAGAYTVAVSPSADCAASPSNVLCETATAVNASELPFFAAGSNELATTASKEASNCDLISSGSKGFWYKVTGDGSCLSLAIDLSDFNTVVAVYNGPGCEELHCVNQRLNDGSHEDDLQIQTLAGLTYYVFVGGYYSLSVEFDLEISKTDECSATSQYCTMCADGNYPNRSMTFDGASCAEWQRSASFTDASSEDCPFFHIVGSLGCGCPANETGICNLCPDGSNPAAPDAVLFNFDEEPTCGEWSTIPAVDGNTTCGLLQANAFYCGCPGVEGCELCLNGTSPADRLLPAFLFEGNATCATVESVTARLKYPEECGNLFDGFQFDFGGFCCRDREPVVNCSLCGDPSLVRDLDLGFANCREVDDSIAFLTSERSCQSYLSSYADFCCLDLDECPLCPDGGSYDASVEVPGLAFTCGLLDAVPVERLGANETCDSVQNAFAYVCGCPNVTKQCSVCLDGSFFAYPDRKIYGTENFTCRDFDNFVSTVSSDQCGPTLDEIESTEIDLPAYCGCPDAVVPDECNLCGGNASTRPDALVPNSGGLTCAELAEYARSVTNSEVCSDLAVLGPLCCTDEDPFCKLCQGAGKASYGNKTIMFLENATCEEIESAFYLVGDEETCSNFSSSVPIDLPSWCGCANTTVPNVCEFCPAGTAVLNGDRVVGDAGIACRDAQRIALFVTNTTFCENQIKEAADLCCDPVDDNRDNGIVIDDNATAP